MKMQLRPPSFLRNLLAVPQSANRLVNEQSCRLRLLIERNRAIHLLSPADFVSARLGLKLLPEIVFAERQIDERRMKWACLKNPRIQFPRQRFRALPQNHKRRLIEKRHDLLNSLRPPAENCIGFE